ncbi:MAG: SPFH domain-containing protein [Planctomycetota bacterium]
MQKILTPLIALIVLIAIALFSTAYTVRFTEVAVLTTFGGVSGDDGEGESSAVKREPGLYFKLPFPVQSVTTYDRRGRFVETKSTTVQTADNAQIIVELFAMWRVEDPLEFFRRFSNAPGDEEAHYNAAEEEIKNILATALGETSKYAMSDLFTTNGGGSRIPELEQRILESVRAAVSTDRSSGGDLGIAVDLVGINRILLPQETTQRVFERMAAGRDRLASELNEQGTAIATAITSQADADAKKIRAFADRLASEIRADGIREAATFLEAQNELPELAVFLRNIELMEEAMSQRMTLIMSQADFGFGIFGLDTVASLKPGQFPLDLPGGSTLTAVRGDEDVRGSRRASFDGEEAGRDR